MTPDVPPVEQGAQAAPGEPRLVGPRAPPRRMAVRVGDASAGPSGRGAPSSRSAELEHALSLLQATLDSTADGILVVDTQGRIASSNCRFAEMWRIPEAILESGDDNRALAFVLDQLADPEGFLAKVRSLYATPEAESFDALRFKDGRVFERYSRPQRLGEEVVGRVWSFRDVTDARRAESDLEARALELARSNEELEKFAYVASHDLQEPLRMVASYVQLLERRYGSTLGPEAHEYIRFAAEGAKRMQGLINDLLVYSRVGTHGAPLEPVDSGAVLDRVLEDLHVALRESGGTIERGLMPRVQADASQLGQLLQNLLSNALKFRGEAPLCIQVGAARGRDEWEFHVTDNGIGFDAEYADRIFVIFQRLHPREKYPGTGVGLAIAKKIVERHGGRIWAESQPGRGATFRFTLPARQGVPDP